MPECGPGSVRFAFDATNPQALRWAETRSSRLIVDITREQRLAVREIIGRAFAEQIPPRETAKLIRSVVGLTDRDANAVMRRQLDLMADGVSPAEAQRQAERYAGELHRARALTIARTETMAASNAGQQALWNQAVTSGRLSARMQKIWLSTYDERTCPQCQLLEGETVLVEEEFSSGGNPPAHPLCRCSMGLVGSGR